MTITRKIRIDLQKNETQQAFLRQISGGPLKAFRLYDQFYLGREMSNDIVLPNDNFISRRHALIKHQDDGFYIEDLNSQNGVFINGVRIREVQLREGDQIRLGSSLFVFSSNQESESSRQNLRSYNLQWNAQLERLPLIANSEENVLLQGESGTGKEILSRKIHELSPRHQGPYVTLNCSSFNASLIESELFGHHKGSYTDAVTDRKGAFVQANGGSLFLDEIGDMPLDLQAKLLRALENREVKPLGSDQSIAVDVRIIAASHKDLRELVQQGKFRHDLYYRLNIIRFSIPPLRERREDITPLLFEISREFRVHFKQEAVLELNDYSWPGNVRELKNLVRRAAAIFPQLPIGKEELGHLIDFSSEVVNIYNEDFELPTIKRMEKKLIENALRQSKGNQRLAAKQLGMPKSTFNDKLRRYHIDWQDYQN